MKISDLEWDDDNLSEIGGHNVHPSEVEDICFGLHFSQRDSPSKSKGKERYILTGQTSRGKYLDVIIERLHEAYFRPATAFEMSPKYISIYLEKKRRRLAFEERKENERRRSEENKGE